MDFDLRLLRHARALAEHGSFARAARAVHLTQPALSRSIQELERRTGIRLFERAKGGVEPTDVGRAFLEHARALLGHAEALDREVTLLRGATGGELVVGAGTFPSATFMGPAVSAFLQANPRVGLRLVSDTWLNLIAALRRRELDLVVAAAPPKDELGELSVTPLAVRQGYFLVRPGHPLCALEGPALADVVAFPIASTARLTPQLISVLLGARQAREGGRPLPDLACESVALMRQVAATTDHVLMAPIGTAADDLAAGRLVVLPVVVPDVSAPFAITRLRQRTLPPVADALARAVVAADRQAVLLDRSLVARHLRRPAARARGRRAETVPAT